MSSISINDNPWSLDRKRIELARLFDDVIQKWIAFVEARNHARGLYQDQNGIWREWCGLRHKLQESIDAIAAYDYLIECCAEMSSVMADNQTTLEWLNKISIPMEVMRRTEQIKTAHTLGFIFKDGEYIKWSSLF